MCRPHCCSCRWDSAHRSCPSLRPFDFPAREVLVFVTVCTLLGQGLTLPALARRLGTNGPDAREDAVEEVTGCTQCEAEGRRPDDLALCLTCGHIGCESELHYAREHYEATGHPVLRSFTPGESWRHCLLHDVGTD